MMASDHRDKERGDATPFVGGVERDTPLELLPAIAESVGNLQRVHTLEDRAIPPQLYKQGE
jgi:hypothetical protein